LNGAVVLDESTLFIDDETNQLLSRSVILPGDLLISIAGTIGRTGVVSVGAPKMNCNQAVAIVRLSNQLSNRYLQHWFATQDAQCQMAAGKVTQTISNLSLGQIKALTIPFPTSKEQNRIVEILDQADHLRKLRVEADKKAERILSALFNKMFGDPATNPMGWETERLDQLFEVVGGGTPSKSEPAYWQGEIPWVSPKDMKKDVITDTEDHITTEAIANSATRLVSKGSILIVYRSGILVHTFPVAIAGRELSLNQDLKAINSKSELMNEYLYGWLVANPRMTLGCVKTGATVHNVDGQRFLALEVGKPPHALQNRFAKQLRTLLEQKRNRVNSSEQIESLFSLLLQRAFSGTLTASWREAHMKELLAEMEQQAKYLNNN
jgi:type I restriction enzyme S subunit